jgi:hypothetical protein
VAAEFVVGLVVEALDRGLFDGSVHALDLAVGPRVLGLGEAMIDAGESAGVFEGMSPERLFASDLFSDLGRAPGVAARIGEVSPSRSARYGPCRARPGPGPEGSLRRCAWWLWHAVR